MKITTALFLLLISIQGFTAATNRPAKIRFMQSFNVEGGNEYLEDLSHKGCFFSIAAESDMTISKNTVIGGFITNEYDREVRRSAGEINKQATSQFKFVSSDESITVMGGCNQEGMFFPALGLPSLEEVYEMLTDYVIVK